MSRGLSGHVGVANLHPDDLVDDRELAAVEDDRLAHAGIVDQLAELAVTIPTPSNIALYGPWGSGKSGIANLLKSKIDGLDKVRFVRFDAFKYADVPLRRNFISAVANELGCTQSKYHGDLYSGRTKTEIKVPPTTIFKLLGVFAALLFGLAIILTVLVAAVALGQSRIGDNTDFGVEFKTLSKHVVLAGLLPATLLAALIALASKTFSVDRSLAKPDSDEQFERIFKNLVSDAKAKRLVIFVDELDRCSPSEVVTTLDTIRTFLGIDRCIFIVAADQNVLEQALTRAAKQETPADDANPYYSTGSAYLDKVFQYQLSLPPLLAQGVSKYATSLIENREGLWAEVNREYVLSVLIPTHVTSPRRVKHLLNTFALTYRLALERYKSELLADEPSSNAAAIARLVSLRVEFPLFARHLEVDADLPSLVLRLMRNPNADLPPGTTVRAAELARSYALENAAPSTVLVDDGLSSDELADDRTTQIVETHNKQLLNYLSRTRQVPGPSRDLIYMQSTGTVFGLDGALALEVERAAEDVDMDTLQRHVESLGRGEREGLLRVLSNQIRTGTGVSAPNAARSFLLLIEAEPDLPIISVADTVAEEICLLQDDFKDFLDEDTVSAAWELSKVGSEASSTALRRRVIAASINLGSTTPDFLFEDTVLALESSPDDVADFLSSGIVTLNGPATIARLFELGDNDLIRVIKATRERIVARAKEAAQVHTEWTSEQEAVEATSATEKPASEPLNPEAVFDALALEAATRETPVQHLLLGLLLQVDVMGARSAALRLLGKTEPVSESVLVTSIFKAIHRRVLREWADWFAGIVPSSVTPKHAEQVAKLVAKAWNDESDLGTKRVTLDALAPFVSNLPVEVMPNLNGDALESLENAVMSSEEAQERRDLLEQARSFAAADLVDYPKILLAVARTLQSTLAETLTVVDENDPMYQYMSVNGTEALRASVTELTDAEIHDVIMTAAVSPWLDDLGHVVMPLEFAKAVGRTRIQSADLPAVEAIAEVIDNYEISAVHAASLWLELTDPDPEDFASIFDSLCESGAFTLELSEAAHKVQRKWAVEQHRELLDMYLAVAENDVPNDSVLDVLGFANADEAQVAELLSHRFADSTNNTQRQSVVTLWAKSKIQTNLCRRRLFETIIYGLLDLKIDNDNAGAADLALNALKILGDPVPYGIKSDLGKRVVSAVAGNEALQSKALATLPGIGVKITTTLFGKIKRVE